MFGCRSEHINGVLSQSKTQEAGFGGRDEAGSVVLFSQCLEAPSGGVVDGEAQLMSAISVSDFLAQRVLPQLSPESHAYSLLQEFISVCPCSVNNASEL